MVSATISLHHTLKRCRANGPGERFVVWVQGCPRRCKGCWNPDSLVFDGRQPILIDVLANQIIAEHRRQPLHGVTFSGGEPFSQASELAQLARLLKTKIGKDFTVVSYTGHTLEQIKSAKRKSDWQDFLSEIDLLIDGEFKLEQRNFSLPLRGSTNQRLHFLTGKILPEDVPSSFAEYTIEQGGVLTVTGFPQIEIADALDIYIAQQNLNQGERV